MASFAVGFMPRFCPDRHVLPGIGARQEIVLEKRGVCFSGFAWHERSPRAGCFAAAVPPAGLTKYQRHQQ